MSGTLNKVMLIGHLGDDVKMHYFEGGGCLGRFPIATNESYTNRQTGERVTNTEWHNVVVRNKGAEVCEKYLKKGDKIYVEGRLKTRQWQAEDGNTRYSTEIHVQDFTFLTPKNEHPGGYQGQQQSQPAQSDQQHRQSNQAIPQQPIGQQQDGDDLPF
ncbi:single-stranded DNA-binding protein [Pseudofulvibacter geojedonensis]|uniref:Single-stranded DNA-binding protein n=1 Tax=Pseudofulvibacter geojedonensis TaxID=1123758 RepID=A0ABW3I3K7_9FLAO